MALEDMSEEYVVEKLFDKIDLFKQTLGEISPDLTRLEGDDRSFKYKVFERLIRADTKRELESDFDAVAVDLEEQQELAEKLHEFNIGVFEGFDLGATDASSSLVCSLPHLLLFDLLHYARPVELFSKTLPQNSGTPRLDDLTPPLLRL